MIILVNYLYSLQEFIIWKYIFEMAIPDYMKLNTK